jgi:SAM-dependent methyltransferase
VDWLWLIASGVAICFGLGAFFGAPWVPAFRADIDELLDIAGVKKGTKFVDLGCGDGKVLVVAARRGAHVVGFEINPLLWLVAWLRLLPFGKRAKVYLRSFWMVDIGEFDVVYMYLIHHYMEKMRRQLVRQLARDGIVISYMFAFENTTPRHTTRNSFIYDRSSFINK